MGFSDYSVNPDLNVSISGVNIGEGCPPSGINNAMRQIMADAKAFTGGAVLSGGVTIKGGATVSGGLVVSGGSAGMSMATGNINFSKNATISGVAVSHHGQLTMNEASLNFGLYDQTNNKWVVMGSPNGSAYIAGPLDIGSGAVINGTLDLPSSTDAQGSGTAAPALRIGPVSGAHLEFDGNEIMAKATSNTVGIMTLNYDGGRVLVGVGGLTVLGGGMVVSGTISGTCTSAGVATKVGTSTVGGAEVPVYVSSGTVTPCTQVVNTGGVQTITGNKTFSGKVVTDGQFINNGGATFSGGALVHGELDIYHGGGYTTIPADDVTSAKYLRDDGQWASVGSAANASSLGGVAASSYVRKTANLQHGSATLLASGGTMSSGQYKDVSVSFSGFAGTPQVFGIVRGGNGSYAKEYSLCVTSRSTSGCTIRATNNGSAFTASAVSYIDWMAVY